MLQDFIGAVSLGLIWAVMAIAIYITYKILDIADMTVEGSITMGAAISAVCISAGMNPYLTLLFRLWRRAAGRAGYRIFPHRAQDSGAAFGHSDHAGALFGEPAHHGQGEHLLLKMETVYTPFENMGLSKTSRLSR